MHPVRGVLQMPASIVASQHDPVTGLYNQSALLDILFRETDRVQRMKTSLCLILFAIDGWGQWKSRLSRTACDDLLLEMVARVQRLLRTYDLFGRTGSNEFLLGLPGCSPNNAVMLAERIRVEAFAAPFPSAGQAIPMSAGFGIAPSHGRSPVVVLREAAQALQLAQAAGPDSIRCAGDCSPAGDLALFLASASGDDRLAW
jgi:diguanylate cyclase (GGDEF)-like protein